MRRPEWIRLQSLAFRLGEELVDWQLAGNVDEKVFNELFECRCALLAKVELMLAPDYSLGRH